MSYAISINNLSKRYTISHKPSYSYNTLSEVLMGKVRALGDRSGAKEQNTSEDFWALKDVNFEIKEGERLGIIGRNGAGKSTLLKILSRITEPTSGRIVINGRVASLLEVGTGFHPELSGRENIFLNGSILGMSKHEIKNKFDEIVDFSGVEKFLDTPVKRYSSGMYVRLAFAVAAHLEPEILIVDEVLAVGDTEFQKKCIGKMQDVSGSGRTILFVSHNMQAVQKLCNKAILLNKGTVIRYDDVDQVIPLYISSGEYNRSSFVLSSKPTEPFGKVIEAVIEDMNGAPLPEIPVGKSWKVKLLIQLDKSTPHFIVGLGIVSAFDQSIRTSWTKPIDVNQGMYEVIFCNDDLMLTTGMYKLVIGLSTNERPFFYSDDEAYINISDAGIIEDHERVVNTKSGLILNPMKVTMKKID